MKYRKKPVVIDAQQFNGEIELSKYPTTTFSYKKSEPGGPFLYINTPEGTMRASIGDWIITGVSGEVYPCKPEIFAMTYELVTN